MKILALSLLLVAMMALALAQGTGKYECLGRVCI